MSDAARGTGMRCLKGDPVKVGAVTMRAATGYIFGGTVHTALVQRHVGPGDRWSPGRECRHRHMTAEAALECAEAMLDMDRFAVQALR